VAVGSAIGASAAGVPVTRFALDRAERVDPSRARAVTPVAPASVARAPDRRRVPLADPVALAPRPVAAPPAVVPVLPWLLDPLLVATVVYLLAHCRLFWRRRRPLRGVYPQVVAP